MSVDMVDRQPVTKKSIYRWVTDAKGATKSSTLSGKVGFAVGWTTGSTWHLAKKIKAPKLPKLPKWKRKDPMTALREHLGKNIQMQADRMGVLLSDKEVEELTAKIIELLQKVLVGDIEIDALHSLGDQPKMRGIPREYLISQLLKGVEISEEKSGILRQILNENLKLRTAPEN